MSSDTCEKWSISQMSLLFGMCRKTVGKRLNSAGIEPIGKVKGYPVYASDEVGPALFGQSHSSSVDDPNRMSPKDRKDWYQSEIQRLQLEQQEGLLCKAEEVRRTMHTLVQLLVQALETLPDHLERNCALSPSTLTFVENTINEVRVSLHEQLIHAFKPR
ncbi:DUF1441 family protein [Zooshikella marina]|uniref:DUF1441 family protein n=1 Tax=Zooshikella ganghwensis TaxID=202772 RepID=UPI001BAF9A27|nr:DUF1441 family protein [Zooshikella ganghwensis]MBU2709147.1 DUF1441 family protein [Zooshikella ganghwensis]